MFLQKLPSKHTLREFILVRSSVIQRDSLFTRYGSCKVNALLHGDTAMYNANMQTHSITLLVACLEHDVNTTRSSCTLIIDSDLLNRRCTIDQ